MEDVMKVSNVILQVRGFFHRTGRVLLLLALFCTSCGVDTRSSVMLPVTGGVSTTNITFSPDEVDFGVLRLKSTSAAKAVTIQNNGSEPILLRRLSITAGFSIVANTCPKPPETLASQGSCTVDIVFKPNIAQKWVGELQVRLDSDQELTMHLKGLGKPEINLLAMVVPQSK